MTVDIQRFSNHLAAIYANLAKPILDVILYNYQLSQNVGAEGLVLVTALIQGSGALCEHHVVSSTMCSKQPLQYELSRRPSACTQHKKLPCPEPCGILTQDWWNQQKKLPSLVARRQKRCSSSVTTLDSSSMSIVSCGYACGMASSRKELSSMLHYFPIPHHFLIVEFRWLWGSFGVRSSPTTTGPVI